MKVAPTIIRAGAVGIGVIVGKLIDVELNKALPTAITSKGNAVFTQGDVVTFIVGLLVALFGGRIHSVVRWIGVGIFAFEFFETVYGFGTAS